VRIIAGQFRGRNLKSPPSRDVRPTSDRLRETLFNVLGATVSGARFLDLCAGSGAVGVEALSRGASYVTFVDRSRQMCDLIRANLALFKVSKDQAEVIPSEAAVFLRRAARQRDPLDIIFFDPPYAADYLITLDQIGRNSGSLIGAGLIVVEHQRKTVLPDRIVDLQRFRLLEQGDSALSFYRVLM